MLKQAFSLAKYFSSTTYPSSADLSSTTGTFYVSSSSLRQAKWLVNSEKISFPFLSSRLRLFLLGSSILTTWLPSIMIRTKDGADQKWCLLNIFPSIHLPLHYGIQSFEGLKAYKNEKGEVRLFRPWCNALRLKRSSTRLTLPDFDGNELVNVIS